MRIYNNFILALMLAACSIITLLAFFGQNDIKVYFIVITIAYMIITLLYVYLNPRARNALNVIGVVFFGCFLVIVALKVMDILGV